MIISQDASEVKTEMLDVVAAAQAKLARIIAREGDANGLRRSAEYLKHLIAEEILQRQAIAYCRDHYKGKLP